MRRGVWGGLRSEGKWTGNRIMKKVREKTVGARDGGTKFVRDGKC